VATFVSNLVRNVSEIRDEIRDHIYAAAAVADHDDTTTVTTATTAVTTATAAHHHPTGPPSHIVTTRNNNNNSHNSTRDTTSGEATTTTALVSTPTSNPDISTATTLHDLDDMMMAVTDDQNASQEYVLIDGDLVAIPSNHHQPQHYPRSSRQYRGSRGGDSHSSGEEHHHPYGGSSSTNSRAWDRPDHHHEEDDTAAAACECEEQVQQHYASLRARNDLSRTEEEELAFLEQQDRANCKASRMRRGVRKFKRWKKNLKKKLGFRKDGDGETIEEESVSPQSSLVSSQQQSGLISALTAGSSSGRAVVADDDSSSIATNTVPSMSETSSVAAAAAAGTSSPGRQSKRYPQKKKKKNRLGWLRDSSDRSCHSSSSSSLMQGRQGKHSASSSSLQQQKQSSRLPSTVHSPTSSLQGGSEVASLNMDAFDGGDTSFDSSSVASGAATSVASSAMTAPPLVARAAMPTLAETSIEMSSSTTAPATAEFTAMSPLHATVPATTATLNGLSNGASAGLDGSTTSAMGPPLMPDPHSFHRSSSIAAEASFVGNADSLFVEAGVLPDSVAATEYYIEDRLDDYDKYDLDKKDAFYDPYLRSVVPRDADFKVDKQEAPSVDCMLRQAGEFAEDLENSVQDTPLVPPLKLGAKGKSEGESVPLSMASSSDTMVHNDILKLVLVGANDVDKSGLARSLRQSAKKPKKRTTLAVDVHSWMPPNSDNVKFTVWDVQGAASSSDPYSANFGAHPGTQSLFFSDRSLYLLVWDMAANNPKTYRRVDNGHNECEDSDDSDDEDINDYVAEEANRQADRALHTDIEDRVLSWVDTVARRGTHSAVLPVALVPSDMSPDEAKRRCDVMQTLIMDHTERKFPAGLVPPTVLSGAETVICVSLDTNMGLDYLQDMIVDIATDASHSVFDHVGTPVPTGCMHVLETVRRLKDNSNKLVLVDHLMAELPMGVELSVASVMESLHFLASIGEVLYYGGSDEILNHYVILSRKWLVSALSCILRNDLKRELSETRRFMNMQCLYSDQQFPESNVTQTFSNNASSCPVVSSQDTQMLWQSMSFMREAADRSSQLSENSTTASTMFGFLEHLLVHTGVFLPLDIDRFASTDNVYFVPSLLSQASTRDVWTYKSNESWMTTLCHSWLFRDGAPVGLMERVTVALLRDLYEFSHIVAANPHGSNDSNSSSHTPPARAQTFPFGQTSLSQFIDAHEGDPIGHIKIHHIVCWKNSVLVKIGRVFPDGNELRESFVEIFVAITDQSSPHSVASDAMRSNMQRLVVSGKGQVGHHGRKLWKGGYNIVLDSIKVSVADCTNVDRQIICPECLAYAHPSGASTWSWDSVRAASDTVIRCMRGHKIDRNLICGTLPTVSKADDGKAGDAHKKPVTELLPAVVVVGLWDNKSKSIRNVGSGFVVDKKLGLIVTAGHILFNMEEGHHFGEPYFGLKDGRAVVGIIPDGGEDSHAVFRYFAEIVAEDIHNVDACVLRITARLENDVDNDSLVGEQREAVVESMQKEPLQSLKTTRRFELEEAVRVLGFNQGGEGLLEQGKHVNRSADFAKGYIVKQFKMADDHSSSSGDSSSSGCGFAPREEIVIMCPTISGHSGGPCVNDEGKVVGILSRGDPVDRQRCYLVPSSEIKILVNKAKKRGAGLKMY